tara:strand:- start:2849 stop:2980 length:132 start_codon:yes stop_codon:yes gene_type:complete
MMKVQISGSKTHKEEIRKLIELSLSNINAMIIYYQSLDREEEE